MAQRDRSQGFGFVYADIATLLKNKESLDSETVANSINFNRDPKPQDTKVNAKGEKTNHAIHEIKTNLDRLQSLHHKLHAVLEELNQITGRKKRS